MRRKNQEITNPAIIEEILSTSEICRLGFIDNGRPYILPFNYGYRAGFIYIHCASVGKKLELIRQNNLVCIEMEQLSRIERYEKACKWSTTYRSAIGYGRVEIITDEAQKRFGLDVIMHHNGANASHDLNYEPKSVAAMSVLKVEITEMSAKQSTNWEQPPAP